MNKNLIKASSLVFTLVLGCTFSCAKNIPMKEIKPKANVLPAVTVPGDKKVVKETVTTVTTTTKEVVENGVKKVEETVTEVKETVDTAKNEAETTVEEIKLDIIETPAAAETPAASETPAAKEAPGAPAPVVETTVIKEEAAPTIFNAINSGIETKSKTTVEKTVK